nr:splicing factor 3B subunit 4-like [Ipomoea batatas]
MATRIAPGVGANLLGQHSAERNQDATAYVGNLDPQVSEELLWELFVQAGPVVNVYVPKDRVTNAHQGYGFVEFRSEEDADYVSVAFVCCSPFFMAILCDTLQLHVLLLIFFAFYEKFRQ